MKVKKLLNQIATNSYIKLQYHEIEKNHTTKLFDITKIQTFKGDLNFILKLNKHILNSYLLDLFIEESDTTPKYLIIQVGKFKNYFNYYKYINPKN